MDMKNLFNVAAGLDVHRDTVVASVRRKMTGVEEDQVETRTFETYRDSLVELSAWLEHEKVEVVGLESTGVYWMPIVRVIQEKTPKMLVWLVNPVDVKRRAGRKTDRKDSRWLSQLTLYGLVAPSFLASYSQTELRKLTRHRTKLIADQTRYQNRILKELECSGVKLPSVVTDCMGKSGRAIIDALLAGQLSLDAIANLARGTLRRKIPLIRRAIDGSFTPSTAMVLKQLLTLHDLVVAQIAAIDDQVRTLMAPLAADQALACTMPGLADVSVAAVLAETGADMSLFPSAKHLTAWAGVAPGSEESAGKAKAAPARQGNKYLRTVLVQCAWSGVRTKNCHWNTAFARLRARLGPKKAILAIARKMLVALFYMLRDSVPYRDPDQTPLAAHLKERVANRLSRRLKALGYQVTLSVAPPVTVS
jgi:transposase